MEKVIIRDDFIKLGQAMKLAGMVGSGVDAKNADPGRTGRGQRRGRIPARQKAPRRRCHYI